MSDPSKDAYRTAISRGEGRPVPPESSVEPAGDGQSVKVTASDGRVATITPVEAGLPAKAKAEPVVISEADLMARIGIPGLQIWRPNAAIRLVLERTINDRHESKSIPLPVPPTDAEINEAKAALLAWLTEIGAE